RSVLQGRCRCPRAQVHYDNLNLRQAGLAGIDAGGAALAGRCAMKVTRLSGCLEEYLALQRTMAESRPRYDRLARNQVNYKEKLLRDFFAFWQKHGSPWPIRATLAL